MPKCLNGVLDGAMKPTQLFYNWLTYSLLFVIFATWAERSIAAGDKQDVKLPRQMKKALDNEVFPSMAQGADAYFYNVFGTVLSKATPEQRKQIDEYAKSLKLDSPLDKFVGLKLMRIEQGIDAANAKMKLNEAAFLIGGINKRLNQFIDSVNTHPFMQEPVEVALHWKEARDQFWDAHVAKNEFLNNSVLLAFGSGILDPLKTTIKNSDDPHTVETIGEFQRLARTFGEVYQDLDERTAEARLIRFERSAETMAGDGSFEDKFIAGMSLQIDSESLIPYLQKNLALNRPKLQQPDLANQLTAKMQELVDSESAIIEKANLFRTGLHWWLRGRYGHGVKHGGLMKSESVFVLPKRYRGRTNATKGPMNYASLNALYMPRKRPDPEFELTLLKPAASGAGPSHYSRRHYYTWAIEDRPIITKVKTSTSSRSISKDVQSRTVSQTNLSGKFFY